MKIKLFRALFVALILAGEYYYFTTKPDCIQVISSGKLFCSCSFKSAGDWEQFKAKHKTTAGGPDWGSVDTQGDPCQDPADFKVITYPNELPNSVQPSDPAEDQAENNKNVSR